MESFAVKCPVPEVANVLRKCVGMDPINLVFYAGLKEVKFCCSGRGAMFTWSSTANCFENYLSIEAAIAELQKPREKPIIIADHEVTFPGDGSIKVGCTVVDAATCDEIEKRRKVKGTGFVYFTDGIGILWRAVPNSGRLCESWTQNRQTWEDVCSGTAETNINQRITEAEAKAKFPAAFTEATP